MTQGEERKESSFAAIVSPHDKRQVFDADDEDQGPKDQRKRTKNSGGSVGLGQRLQTCAQGIKRAGADVAEHHAEGSEREPEAHLRRGRMSVWLH